LATIHHDQVHTGSVRLHVARAGAAGSRLLMFLHGFPESWTSWRKYLDAFGGDFLAVAPDHRGFNDSDRPVAVADYEIGHVVDDIRALVAHYGAQRVTLVGHDWGGIAAWHFAARHAELLERLIILNAPHPDIFQRAFLSDPAQRAASQYMTRLRDPGCETRLQGVGIEAFWMSLFGEHFQRGRISQADKESAIAAWSQPGALTAMLNWYRASPIVVPPDGSNPVVDINEGNRPLMISAPTLVIWGMQDNLLLPCLLDGLQAFVPQLTVKQLDAAGHGLIHEEPDQIIALIRAWMDKS